jgi:mannose-6-phosphate isomerase-like protein (cupin superfamily)
VSSAPSFAQYRLADSVAHLPTQPAEPYVIEYQKGTTELGLYAPRGRDPQSPHTRDEFYVVVSGRGEFVAGEARTTFGPGDALFVAAGVVHRFENFSDDLVVWVVFV